MDRTRFVAACRAGEVLALRGAAKYFRAGDFDGGRKALEFERFLAAARRRAEALPDNKRAWRRFLTKESRWFEDADVLVRVLVEVCND